MYQIQKCQKHRHIEMLHFVNHHLHCGVGVKCRTVRALRDQCGIHIADPQDSRRKRDFVPPQIVRISRPVKIFMVVVHRPEYGLRKIAQLLQLPVAQHRVQPDIFQLFDFKQGVVPSVEIFSELQLSDIMHHPGPHNLRAEFLAAPELRRHQSGQIAHHNPVIHCVREIVFYAFFILQRRPQPLLHFPYHSKRLTSIYPDLLRRTASFPVSAAVFLCKGRTLPEPPPPSVLTALRRTVPESSASWQSSRRSARYNPSGFLHSPPARAGFRRQTQILWLLPRRARESSGAPP